MDYLDISSKAQFELKSSKGTASIKYVLYLCDVDNQLQFSSLLNRLQTFGLLEKLIYHIMLDNTM